MPTRGAMARLGAAAVLLVVANLSLWAWLTLVRTGPFVAETIPVLRADGPRAALASLIVDHLLAEQPLLRLVLGDTAKGALDDLLARPALEPVFAGLARELHHAMVSSGRLDVTLDATTLDALVRAIAGDSGGFASGLIGSLMPSSGIVLAEAGEVPNIHRAAVVTPWVCVIGWVAGLALLGWTVYRARSRALAVVWIGLLLVGVAIVSGLLSLPIRGRALGRLESQDARVIGEALLDRVLGRLYLQAGALALLGLVIAVGGGLLARVWRR